MSKDTGGPAFPALHFDLANGEHGMSLRDYFAAKAMQGSRASEYAWMSENDVAAEAYRIADAMLEARK